MGTPRKANVQVNLYLRASTDKALRAHVERAKREGLAISRSSVADEAIAAYLANPANKPRQ
jgi:hypothetical protein